MIIHEVKFLCHDIIYKIKGNDKGRSGIELALYDI